MIDNSELMRLMEKLENLEDEQLAVKLLKALNDKSKHMGQLILNLDPKLDHDTWKKKCDAAKADLDQVVTEIDSL